MTDYCLPPRTPYSHSRDGSVDGVCANFVTSVYIALMQKAIIAAFAQKGWEGEVDENGDVQVWSEHGNAWFSDLDLMEGDPGRPTFDQQWHRPEGAIVDYEEGVRYLSDDLGRKGTESFYGWFYRAMMVEPDYGPDFFFEDFRQDPSFKVPDFNDDEGDDIDDDDPLDEEETDEPEAAEVDPYWKRPTWFECLDAEAEDDEYDEEEE